MMDQVIPEDATLVVDFLNTLDIETGLDELDTQGGLERWSTARDVATGHRETAIGFRNALRHVVDQTSAETDVTIPLQLRLSSDGLKPIQEDTVSAVAAAVVRLTATDRWHRVKLCAAHGCREAFFDRSRNRSRVWCDMAFCGNAAKSRTFRNRPADGGGGGPVFSRRPRTSQSRSASGE